MKTRITNGQSSSKGGNCLSSISSIVIVFFACLAILVSAHSSFAQGIYVSNQANRGGEVLLAGSTVNGLIYVFLNPDNGISQARFFLDDPSRSSSPIKVENLPPFDFAGTAGNGSAFPYNTNLISNGPHNISVEIDLSSGETIVQSADFSVQNEGGGNTYTLLNSGAPDRSSPTPLEGAAVSGIIHVFVDPGNDISQARFFLDDPSMSGSPTKIENLPPFDLGGTAQNGNAIGFDSALLADGSHTLTLALTLSGGQTEIQTINFSVQNNVASLVFNPSNVTISSDAGGSTSSQVLLETNDGQSVPFSITEPTTAPWLTVNPLSGTTPGTISLAADASSLSPGTYLTQISASSTGYASANLVITLNVAGIVDKCAPLDCEDILIELPYVLDFTVDHMMIPDAGGVGTGFTYIDQPTNGTGYIPSNIWNNTSAGLLEITTTPGLAFTTSNSQDNTLGVGIDAPSQITRISTTIVNPPPGTGKYEQGGLWFGNDEDNYLKLVVISFPQGQRIQHVIEEEGVKTGEVNTGTLNLAGAEITLGMIANPFDRTITATYRINGGTEQILNNFSAPGEFFSFDAAGIDPTIGTNSFGGLFASNRNSALSQIWQFEEFSVVKGEAPIPDTDLIFDRKSYTVTSPTNMAWGPDDRLYVTELFGTIHALTFDVDKQVIDDEVITSIGNRLTLGITTDPTSTPDNVILWVAHSNASLFAGNPNSGIISKLSGVGFNIREDVITGLPRAIANHATNSIHFGPDSRLYIAQGGNTGAGGPNLAPSEFGDMEEQPLSAALLVADVNNPAFDGSCNNPDDIFGPPPCDVVPFATGLRNMYDFVFHSNGSIYGPDNGLGVTGTYPPSPFPPCFGLSAPDQHDPGTQPDRLYLIEEANYYGHPNPYRDECVFMDGSDQGVSPLPNWTPPIFELGNNRSANGTIEYRGDAFCSALDGELLIVNYSVGDNITRIRLSDDGQSVTDTKNMADGFNDPLALTQSPDGTIFVAEFGGDKVTALIPIERGCWSTKTPMPASILDAGGTALDNKLYVVAGKTNTGHVSSLYIYDPVADNWNQGAAMPGAAVENPAVAELNGLLYAFGGSTAPFSGAVANAAVYNPATDTWTSLSPMPTARGGASAKAIGDLIYVVGGMDQTGASVDVTEVYDPVTDTWSVVASMGTRRDNPGSAVFDDKLYVFGGRTRNSDGTTVNGTLDTVEMYDPQTDSWISKTSMPTGRRTMVVGLLNGRAQLMGGEITTSGEAFGQNEEYDPLTDTWNILTPMTTPRHGAAGGTIGNHIYVAGGGPTGGSSFSNVVEAFTVNP